MQYFNYKYLIISILVLLGSFFYSTINAQDVIQSRGVDAAVDYESLKAFGPWDDRNYQLAASDIELLANNESELRDGVPAFYRVEMRKTLPNLLRTGPSQYPRSSLQKYLLKYNGYLINNAYYKNLNYNESTGKFEVKTDEDLKKGEKGREQKMTSTEVRVTSPVGASESAIKIHPFDPDIVIAGSNGPLGFGQKMHYSHDGGQTWTLVELPLGGTCCDPTVDFSSDGSKVYTATLGNGVWFYRSGDNGVTWTDLENESPGDPRREFGTGGSDKEFIHVDKHCASPFQDNIYVTWHEGNRMQFIRSTDFGNTWDTKISFNSDPFGIGSDIVTDANGAIYYAYASTSASQILLKKSTDGGATFEPGNTVIADTEGSFDFPIPAMPNRRVFIYAAIDADLSSGPFGGSVYAAWTDTTAPESGNPVNNHSRVQVGYSRDQGATWTVVTPHETDDMDDVDRFHPWIAVDLDGGVHVVYYDTRNSVNREGVDFYHVVSTDGGQTFSAPARLTSVTSPKFISDPNEWGDYNGLDHVVRRSTVFTDNRDEDGSGGDSEDIYSTTILQGGANNSDAPARPGAIFTPELICEGQNSIPFEVRPVIGADNYEWSFSDGGVTINNNGSNTITIDGIPGTGGTVEVFAENMCGMSESRTFSVAFATEEVCDIANCMINNLSIDNPTIATADIFDVIQTIDSDATVAGGDFKAFRAKTGIELNEGFTVEDNSLFIAQIEDCLAARE